ncbi:hypothetical protein ALP29_201493 [Pseudomonas syringae pv. avii]|uniref:Uncharacterized protein n=1 Tax=Pseudomonas syringae pv. avii TaxID=663959 RepID=A0A3M5V0X8_PSESX|nr:hypothetical protein ALP29_201493 [Pseudomonas syringae pv. avii]
MQTTRGLDETVAAALSSAMAIDARSDSSFNRSLLVDKRSRD